MEVKEKRILSVITYYTLAVLAIAMAVAFIFALGFRTYPTWAKVVYYAWAAVVIGTVCFDIVCTASNRMKFIPGIMVYVLSMACVAMSVLIYLLNTTRIGLPLDLTFIFSLITAISYLTTLLLIAEFVVGEALIEHNATAKELKQHGIRQ